MSLTKKKKESVKQISTLTDQQRAILDSLTGQIAGQVGQGITPYGGQIAAGVSPLQQQAFDMAGAFGSTPEAMARGGALQQIMAGTPAFQASPQEYERAYAQGVEAPALAQWNRDIIPQILHQYGSGGTAGAVYDMLGRSGADLATNLAGQRAQYRLQGLHDQQGALEAAAGRRLAGIEASGRESLMPLAVTSQMGDVQRGITQDQLGEDYLKWSSAQPYNNPWLGFLAPALGTQAFQTYYQPSQTQPSMFGGMLSGIASGMTGGLAGGVAKKLVS